MHDLNESIYYQVCIFLMTDLNNFNIKNICHIMCMFLLQIVFSMWVSLSKGSKQLTVVHMELTVCRKFTTLAYKTSLLTEGIHLKDGQLRVSKPLLVHTLTMVSFKNNGNYQCFVKKKKILETISVKS